MTDTHYRCRDCGNENNTLVKFCSYCGAENELRTEELAKLEAKRKDAELKRALLGVHELEKKPDMHSEILESKLTRQAKKLRMEETKLKIGKSHEDLLLWIKEQFYGLERSIQDIAEDLGESIIRVAKYIDEIDEQHLDVKFS